MSASRGEDGHSVSWHNHISACFLFQTVSQFMVFIPLSQPCLSSSDLASLVFVLLCMVMLFWFFFQHLPFLPPAAKRSWPAGLPLYAKEHLAMSSFVETPVNIFGIFTYFLNFDDSTKKSGCDTVAECHATKKRFLSFFLYLLTHILSPALMASTCTVTHTLRATFSSRGFLPWCDYNSNAIVPLYVNVYYFSRYICSALLYSILFHPLHISIYIIELLIGLFSLPSALMQAAFEIQRLISVVRWCEANGHFLFFFCPSEPFS